MCGIAGIFHFDYEHEVDQSLLQKMTDVVHHRGPDGEGFYLSKNIGLGHRRLSIIDLNTGDQPMQNEEGSLVVVLNGEIYNYLELKKELEDLGHRFRTTSDTEVVLKAYEQWGINCQTHFNGMWAFALWDVRKKRLLISRDRLGEKPLHYAHVNGRLVFGSEIKSLLKAGIPASPRLELMELYLVFKHIPEPHTFYKDIYKLKPGHFLLVDQDGMREEKYWELPHRPEEEMLNNKEEVYERFRELLTESVKIRMRSDVPFGAFLSGGLDSSTIVALMSGIQKEPVHTFTIGYAEKEFDEGNLAREVANRYGTQHHPGEVEATSLMESLEKVVHHYDEPFGDSSAIPTGMVSAFAVQHVKMVLTGDGGDEALSGYPSFQGVKFAQRYQRMPGFVQKGMPGLIEQPARLLKNRYRYKLNRYAHLLKSSGRDFQSRLLEKRAKPNLSIIRNLIDDTTKTWSAESYLNEFMQKVPYQDDFYRLMFLNFKFDLPNDYLVKVDRMSMAHSLETRLPFLDHRLVEFMSQVHKSVKMQGWETKSVLRKSMGHLLPEGVLKGQKKGFRVPVREWLKEEGHKKGLIQKINTAGLLKSPALRQIIDENSQGVNDHGNLLWSLLVLGRIVE